MGKAVKYTLTDIGTNFQLIDETGAICHTIYRYGVWQIIDGQKPECIENSNDLDTLRKKYGIDEKAHILYVKGGDVNDG